MKNLFLFMVFLTAAILVNAQTTPSLDSVVAKQIEAAKDTLTNTADIVLTRTIKTVKIGVSPTIAGAATAATAATTAATKATADVTTLTNTVNSQAATITSLTSRLTAAEALATTQAQTITAQGAILLKLKTALQ